jgi:two-component system, OmpR family, sensor histidine kinase KdpD
MARGTLRIYLGAAPGVGKTFAMLGEGRRRHERGTDVVVGFVETHGRAKTAVQIEGLEVVPRTTIEYRGATFEEMDVEAVLARRPEVALVDELAHSNVSGVRNQKRWQDIEELLAAGITVISTLNIQHLESVNDVVEQITGIKQRETVPDEVVRRADQIELVDMAPEAIRRRMAHGNIYPAERIDAALANYFRVGNLGALRELALLWVADRVDEALQEYRESHGIERPWETRERVLVALTGADGGDRLIRRGARMAARTRGDLVAVHVSSQDGLAAPSAAALEWQRRLVEEIGGTYREVVGADVGSALVETARELNATQIILGSTRRSRWVELTRGSVINQVIRTSGPGIDVHVISAGPARSERPPVGGRRRPATLPRRRQLLGLALACSGALALTVLLAQLREHVGLPSVLLLFLLLVVFVSAVGGLWPALVAAVGGFLLVNWYFTPPLYTFTIGEGENLLALLAFLVVAVVVSVLVELAARRATEGARARAEAEAFARLAGASPVPSLLDSLRRILGLDAASLLEREEGGWRVEASVGAEAPAEPEAATAAVEVDDEHVLALAGAGVVAGEDTRVLNAFVAELASAIELEELEAEASEAGTLAVAGQLRTALLSAVSHDLRTPLSAIKASVTSLLQRDVEWTPAEQREFLATIDEETDRLSSLVGNLLDMSRLQTGALEVSARPVGLDEVVWAALTSLGVTDGRVQLEVAETLPAVLADPGLLERAVANVVGNALAWSPPEVSVRLVAGVVGSGVDLRVVDRGPGIAERDRERVFQPFQRLGDVSGGEGVGLGLAVARGFVEAMGGEVEIEDTPGGGLTMVLRLRTAS